MGKIDYNDSRNAHRRIKICVSGAADTTHCGDGALDIAKELGREIVRQGAVIVTGATTGWPLWSTIGAKEEGGLSIGVSPASTEKEHVEEWGLPIDYLDVIIYTGQGFSGRDILLTRTTDAVILGCGRIGTIHEFTVAFEDGKPIGILEGCWDTDETLKTILERGHRPNDKIVFDSDPKRLVAKIIEMVETDKERLNKEGLMKGIQSQDGVKRG
ncbi:MAG TPA: hypothetical protein PLY95_00850 [Candidatus Paceibacterota bacterium]|jgi:hypothetical protein|nr:hypothetical protein [Candidatus Paceibacterota bacterium]HQF40828.1 hypothetical protein [Candidatus Paceibacterota bacterium]HQI25789.1 hypothetical protein [Candidatus Paceibacterota bacterium]HQJ83719.1 hypothetical protein [Candidatus Paceibacterota bacterium]